MQYELICWCCRRLAVLTVAREFVASAAVSIDNPKPCYKCSCGGMVDIYDAPRNASATPQPRQAIHL